MILVPATRMSAAGIERSATPITTGAGNGLAVPGILWCREKHLPKRKGDNAGEDQQKQAKMHPTGRVHQGLLPRPGCHFHSTERM